MRGRRKSAVISYAVSTAVGALLCLSVLSIQQFGSAPTLLERYRILCDAFSVPGMLLILSGAMVFVSSEGAFDGLNYGVQVVIHKFMKKDITYHDFLEERREKRKESKGYGFLIVTGLGFMAVALVFLVLFNSVS